MQSSQEQSQQQNLQYNHALTQRIIMLPSKHIPHQLSEFIFDAKDFSIKFLNGYKNILIPLNENQLQWSFTKNQNYCGQTFCYLLKSNIDPKILIKTHLKNHSIIQQVTDQLFVVQFQSLLSGLDIICTVQQVKKLINDVSEKNEAHKISINLIKNAFQSFEQYEKCAGQSLQKIEQELKAQQEQNIPTVAETITLEQNAKKLQKDMSKKVPKCNQQTGSWDETQLIEIKLSVE